MNSHLPPVPPENRSPKGTGETSTDTSAQDREPDRQNFDKQGRQGNIKVNTTNQGYQQDR